MESPPLLIVCDLDRFEVHTDPTGTAKGVCAFNLADLPTDEQSLVGLDAVAPDHQAHVQRGGVDHASTPL